MQVNKHIYLFCPELWNLEFRSDEQFETKLQALRQANLFRALVAELRSPQEINPSLLIGNYYGQNYDLTAGASLSLKADEIVEQTAGILFFDLNKPGSGSRSRSGLSFRLDLPDQANLFSFLDRALEADIPYLGLGSGFSNLVYLLLNRELGRSKICLAPDSELAPDAIRIFWPHDLGAGRHGSEQSLIEPDPDFNLPFETQAPLILAHSGERELHPALQGRIYRAGGLYVGLDQGGSKVDCLVNSGAEFQVGLISDFDFTVDPKPEILTAFVKRVRDRAI